MEFAAYLVGEAVDILEPAARTQQLRSFGCSASGANEAPPSPFEERYVSWLFHSKVKDAIVNDDDAISNDKEQRLCAKIQWLLSYDSAPIGTLCLWCAPTFRACPKKSVLTAIVNDDDTISNDKDATSNDPESDAKIVRPLRWIFYWKAWRPAPLGTS